ncbi:hypothetical protein TNCV_2804761 [Trichonephila clavipes]|nr:hypothetical protein TNCV_2804761 [Trichonephila clavipes]
MVLKANDRRTSCPCHDKFRGPRSDYVRQTSVHSHHPELYISFSDAHSNDGLNSSNKTKSLWLRSGVWGGEDKISKPHLFGSTAPQDKRPRAMS